MRNVQEVTQMGHGVRIMSESIEISRDPTFIGYVCAVSGSKVTVQLSASVASGLPLIEGRTYRIGQVGTYVRIPQGYQDLYGVVSEVEVRDDPIHTNPNTSSTGRLMHISLVGEALAGEFERGISQFPNLGDRVHLAVEKHIKRIFSTANSGQIVIGTLSSAEGIKARIGLNELVTRHSAILGSTGSGKSTTVASLLRSITTKCEYGSTYPSARILLLDVHGEYSSALNDVASVYAIEPQNNEKTLYVPYWAIDTIDILTFLTDGVEGHHETAFTDKIVDLKFAVADDYPSLDRRSITVDTPLPYSLKKLWYDLIDFELTTFEGENRDSPAQTDSGNPDELIAPKYKPHGLGSRGPFLNPKAPGILRQLASIRSKLLDHRYDFLLHPGPWEPDLNGKIAKDMDELLEGWLGGPESITILDLSSVPSSVQVRLIGSILKIVFDALFWSREKSGGGIDRPLLVVMEEAHRYLSKDETGIARTVINRIAKEGRKYGVGAMVVSQRPSEVDETVLSQCGTFIAMRLSNPIDRQRVHGSLPDGLVSLMDVLPILRNGEALIVGEASKLPMRCRISLPSDDKRPNSADPEVTEQWSLNRKQEGYDRIATSWRTQNPRAVTSDPKINRQNIIDKPTEVK